MAYLVLNHHGFLSIRFRVKVAGKLIQCCEGTKIRAKKSGDTFVPDDPRAFEALEKWVRDITREIDAGGFSYLRHFPHGNKAKLFKPGGPRVFRDHAEEWLQKKAPPELRLSTHQSYTSITNFYLIPLFGDSPLFQFSESSDRITEALKKKLVDQKASPRTMKYTFVVLRMMLKTAKIDFPIPRFSGSNRKRPLAFCTEAERDFFLSTVDHFYEPWFFVQFHTGMRPSEQLALREKNFDFAYKRIEVYNAIVRGEEGPTKTDGGQRTIDMEPGVEAALLRWMKIRKKIKADHDLFFCRPNGLPLDQEYLSKHVWHKWMKKADLRRREMYSTRHTFATIALTQGRSPAWVAQMMGDRIETVLKNYFHFLPDLGKVVNRSPQPDKRHP